MTRRYKIVQSEHLSEGPARWLAQRADLIVHPFAKPGFNDALADADGLIVRTYTQVNGELLNAAPNLKVVGRAGVSLENVDAAACRRRGVEVVYAPGSNTQGVVEYVLCLLCDALRPRATFSSPLRLEDWEKIRAAAAGRREMGELSLGILGMGRIGTRLAAVASAIGFRVLYNDIVEIPPDHQFGARTTAADDLFRESDVISIHIDARPGNRRFVGARLIGRMKSAALFINTSRGMVVDHAALASFLRGNPNARAMIDVHDPEPPPADYPLFGVSNAVLLPHLAGRTDRAMENMSWVVKDVLAVLEERSPEHPAPGQLL